MAAKPTIIIVHDAHHVPAHFNLLYAELRRSGYVVTMPSLPSTHVKPAITSQEPDRQAVRDALDIELSLGNDVVVLAHSYGGVPTAAVLQGRSKKARESNGKTGGVVAMIYLASFVLDVGKSLADLDEEAAKKHEDDAIDGYRLIPDEQATKEFYSNQKPEIADANVALLRPWSLGILRSPAVYAPWEDGEIACTYVMCEKDQVVPPSFQEVMCSGKGMEIVKCDADHSPFLDRPEWVARAVRKVAGEEGVEV